MYQLNFPNPITEIQKHRELILYSWKAAAMLREAQERKARGDLFAMLTLPLDIRPDPYDDIKIKYGGI